MTSSTEKLSVTEKIGYSLGDLAANLVFQTLVTFIAFFYTDVYKIPVESATKVIFVCGLIAAFFNPLMGMIADRTQTRWGKFRPWILWTAVPFGVLALLAFSTPNFGPDGKIYYAFVTYLLLLLVYSANNLPYSALSGVITGNMQERNSMSAYRFVAVMVAQFIIQVLLLPLVLIAGDGDKALGFEKVMTFLSIAGVIMFLITFWTTKERVVPKPEQKSTIAEDLKDLFGNKPWIIMLIVTILVFVTLALKGGMYIFYFENYLDASQIALFLENIGFNSFINGLNNLLTGIGLTEFRWPEDPATSGFALFNAGGIIFMIIGIGFSKSLADKYGKREVFGGSLFMSTVFISVFYFYPPDAIGIVFTSQVLHGFFYGISTPLLWAMIADVADYSEWKTERRATAIIFSAMIVGLKVGLTLGSSILSSILDYYDYSADLVTQMPDTINGIKLSVSIFASIPFYLAVACLFAYSINKAMEQKIEQDLTARRQAS
ncbi:MFS transporter [Paraglaciecola aquimarina]|uniref:MFS transporter n=1 Tax=Paraglaciecola algarum TaxID=3050085 RepID=A0ABS9D6J1_9ALTE|nr:MFS transporter [Paraglaciecola sp. G1-23]MCF2948541.1 MFS transporter [Paraglaciecola sp. G1-23]